MPYPLRIASLSGYAGRLEDTVEKLRPYRDGAVGLESIEDWLCNFNGFVDQDCALSLVEDLLVLTEGDIECACGDLLHQITVDAGENRIFHLIAESSGASLVRKLEKVHQVRGFQVLRGRDFFHLGRDHADEAKLSAHLRKMTIPHVVVVWDTMLGTGSQMKSQRRTYEPIFAAAKLPFCGIKFAFITGQAPVTDPDSSSGQGLPSGPRDADEHSVAVEALTSSASKSVRKLSTPVTGATGGTPLGDDAVYIWREAPVWSDRQRDMNERYASFCPDRRTHETGALVTLPDNPPNNTPVVLRSRSGPSWTTLLNRRETVRP